MKRVLGLMLALSLGNLSLIAQEQSVKPGINDSFKNPDVKSYVERFEGESREVYAQREKIVEACAIKPGMVIADVGAGTGFYTRLFAKTIGEEGQVFAVDITPKFIEHIRESCELTGVKNVSPVLCQPDSVNLPPASVDLVYICDTYHHFEFPQRTMASIHRALKPNGRIVLIDFVREQGQSSEWTMNHVRAGQATFEKEIILAGFKKDKEVKDVLKENYFVIFSKVEEKPAKKEAPATPEIPKDSVVKKIPNAVFPAKAGMKVVFDVTGVLVPDFDTETVLLQDKLSTLLQLAELEGLKPSDLDIHVVLHGNATNYTMNNDAYKERMDFRENPAIAWLEKYHKLGVKFSVCGQSLNRRKIPTGSVLPFIKVASSALTSVITLQQDGYACIPIK